MRWIAGALAALMITAGCIAGELEPSTAMSELSTARDAAEDRLSDPALVNIWGLEPLHRMQTNHSELVVHADPDPGDGHAPGWTYHFRGAEGHVFVVVASGLGVLAEYQEHEDIDEDEANRPAIEGWLVDSDTAAGSLARNASWPDLQEHHSVAWELSMHEDRPVWRVVVLGGDEPFDGDEVVAGLVDAREGRVLAVQRESWNEVDAGPSYGAEPEPIDAPCASDRDDGRVTVLGGLQASVDLPADGHLHVRYSFSGAGPITFTLVDEERDDVIWADEAGLLLGAGNGEATIEADHPGRYTLRAHAGSIETVQQASIELVGQWGAQPCTAVEMGITPVDPPRVDGGSLAGPTEPLSR